MSDAVLGQFKQEEKAEAKTRKLQNLRMNLKQYEEFGEDPASCPMRFMVKNMAMPFTVPCSIFAMKTVQMKQPLPGSVTSPQKTAC